MQPKIAPGRHGAARVFLQGGLTLIELVVVIAILCAIAGMVSSYGSGMVRRSGGAVGGASLMEVMKAVERHRTRHGRFPDGYDSLIGAPYTIYAGIPAASRRQLRPKDLDNADRVVLRGFGITTAWMHAAPDGQAVTWQPMSTTKALDVTAGGFAADDVAILDTSRINPDALFGRGTRKGTHNESFVVLGIGSRCSLVGANAEMVQAPVAPAVSAATDPHDVYMRLALVYRLDRDDRRPLQLLGAVAFTDTGISTSSDMARTWHGR
jgi:prepilin-type N-terminal cleavage/methylation domain-containing protein